MKWKDYAAGILFIIGILWILNCFWMLMETSAHVELVQEELLEVKTQNEEIIEKVNLIGSIITDAALDVLEEQVGSEVVDSIRKEVEDSEVPTN